MPPICATASAAARCCSIRRSTRRAGEQSGFHAPHERFRFEAQHLDELRALKVGALRRPEQCLAIIATGDELLDWREMADYYAGCQLHVIQGSDHSLSDFDQHLPTLLDHLDLST
jgi:predicted esterase YcpF (UPF0227 family)